MRSQSHLRRAATMAGAASVLACIFGLPGLLADETRPTALAEDRLARLAAATIHSVSMLVDEHGTLTLAGVRNFQIDGEGIAVVEVQRNGDFNLDPVLTMRVPVFVGQDGALVAGGIEAIGDRGDTVVLVIRQNVGAQAGRDLGDDPNACQMVQPLPSGPVECRGDCTASAPECKFAIIEVPDGPEEGGNLVQQESNQYPIDFEPIKKQYIRCKCQAATPVAP